MLVPVLVIAAAFGSAYAAELTQQTLASWGSFIDDAKLDMQKRLTGKAPFLWVDEGPMWRLQLNSGEIVVSRFGKSNPLIDTSSPLLPTAR